MGNSNIGFNKTCCKNYCKNEKEIVDSYLNLEKGSIDKVIKLQSYYRKFRVRNKLVKGKLIKGGKFVGSTKNLQGHYTQNNTNRSNQNSQGRSLSQCNTADPLTAPTFDFSQIPGTVLDLNAEINTHNKVLEIEKKLGPFKLNEKENCFISYNNLVKVAVYYKDNTFYKGFLNKEYQKEGHGIYYLPDGSKYEGFFKNDMMSGRGRLINVTNKFYYEGNFINNKANGFGRYVTFDGSIYVGYWQEDKQHGLGEEVFPDGSRYEGNFENGKKQGKGVFIFKDGSKYEGEFQSNVLNGYGSYVWSDGKIYQGTWVDNKMDGRGVFIWTDKKKYIGEYKLDKKHGYGVFFWPDDKKYEGMWENGKQNGLGKITQSNISQIGEWENGRIVKVIKESDPNYEEVNKFLAIKKKESKIVEMPEMKLRI